MIIKNDKPQIAVLLLLFFVNLIGVPVKATDKFAEDVLNIGDNTVKIKNFAGIFFGPAYNDGERIELLGTLGEHNQAEKFYLHPSFYQQLGGLSNDARTGFVIKLPLKIQCRVIKHNMFLDQWLVAVTDKQTDGYTIKSAQHSQTQSRIEDGDLVLDKKAENTLLQNAIGTQEEFLQVTDTSIEASMLHKKRLEIEMDIKLSDLVIDLVKTVLSNTEKYGEDIQTRAISLLDFSNSRRENIQKGENDIAAELANIMRDEVRELMNDMGL